MAEAICPVCSSEMKPLFSKLLLKKYKVPYQQCSHCRFVQTASPYWLEEAYEEAISEYDVGLLRRNLRFSGTLIPYFNLLMGPEDRGLDVSGGYGIFTRLMRDKGFDFYTTDPYCKNIFAKGFEPGLEFKALVFTLFEALEHVENPLAFLQAQIEKWQAEYFVISAEPYLDEAPDSEWWYLMPESGQHISFFHPDTFKEIAKHIGWHHLALDGKLQLFSKNRLPRKIKQLCRNDAKSRKLRSEILMERKGLSFTQRDHDMLKQSS